jgi:hypothetical protein
VAATIALWLITMFFRGLEVQLHPWQPMWVAWVVAHDLIAGFLGFQIARVLWPDD